MNQLLRYASRVLVIVIGCFIGGLYPEVAVASNDPDSLLPACEWCGLQDAPSRLDWKVKIPPDGEPGIRIVISGVVYHKDGTTPAQGVIIYVYHTNQDGIYPRRGDETGNARRHGYLRAWIMTDSLGRYEFDTIKPAPYPGNNRGPAHIHFTVTPRGKKEYWINSLWFEGDPLITDREREKVTRSGGFSNITPLVRDSAGVLRGHRNIKLRE